MTRASVAEVVRAARRRYLRANRRDKTPILDEFVAITGYHRKAAIAFSRTGGRTQAPTRHGAASGADEPSRHVAKPS